MITGVEVYSRLPLAPAGYISLPPSHILWTGKNYLTIWKISPADSQPKAQDSAAAAQQSDPGAASSQVQ
jgi:hypothetical protein